MKHFHKTRYYWLLPTLLWGGVSGIFLFWNLQHLERAVEDIALEQGRALFEIVEKTKLNPDAMVSNTPEFNTQNQNGVIYQMVSANPENMKNLADEWEAQKLASFQQKNEWVFERTEYGDEKVYRYIGPVFMENSCMSCHDELGYQVGDLRGGISIVLERAPILASQQESRNALKLIHLGAFLLLSLTSVVLLNRFRNQWRLIESSTAQVLEKERFLSSITDAMGEGCMVLEPSGCVIFINPLAERLLGWPFADLANQDLHALIHRDGTGSVKPKCDCAIHQTLLDGKTRKVNEDYFTHREGRRFPVAYTVSAKKDDGIVREAVLTFDDITESKRAELQASNLTQIINETLNEIYVFDAETLRFLWVNIGASLNLGYNEEELLQLTPFELKPEYDRALFEQLLEPLRQNKKQKIHFESAHSRKDGSLYPVEIYLQLATYDRKPAFIAIASDISERKIVEDERRNLERRLNQVHKLEAVGQLASGIAHEINTPIQYIGDNLHFLKDARVDYDVILENYQQLLQRAREVDELQDVVRTVEGAFQEQDFDYLKREIPSAIEQSIAGVEQVKKIVGAMKEFAHPGKQNMEFADLNRIVSSALSVSKNEWKHVAETTTELDSELPQVKCFGGDISQVVLNLIVNAAHAIKTTQQEEKGLIELTTGMQRGMVEIRVRDTGPGIPEAIREQVFNPFFTTKEVGQGTGQGLAIARDIVVGRHQGELFFETEVGRGTVFILRLPLTQKNGQPHSVNIEHEGSYKASPENSAVVADGIADSV